MKGVYSKLNVLSVFILLATWLLLSSCSTIETIPGATGSVSNAPVASAINSPLLNFAISPDISAKDKNWAHILNIGEEALLARIHLIRSAKKSIDIQTLIWINDEAGRFVIFELIQAAKRGVKVQLLIDHIASEQNIEIAAFLASVHHNFEIKIYNPISGKVIDPSSVSKMKALFLSFNQFNQRMHNKIFTVDDVISITGGRNYQNAYFDQAKGLNYKDRDVIIIGPVVQEMRASFQAFWNYKRSINLKDFIDVKGYVKHNEVKVWETKKSFQLHGFFENIDQHASQLQLITELFVNQLTEVRHAYFIADNPGKNRKKWFGRFRGSGKITKELAKLISQAEESIYIQTPYLVLTDPAVKIFKEIREKSPDIDIRISTNSLAATDSWYVYALSHKQKKTYLDNLKFIMYEIKPHPEDMNIYIPTYQQLCDRYLASPEKELPRAPYLCLHAKSMVVDDKIAFIGSYNLDPRSENINTEAGLVVWDRRFAKRLKDNIKKDMEPQNSWVVGKKEIPLGLTMPNAVVGEFSFLIPIVDPWPIRYATSFELIEGKQFVELDHEDFYDNYRDVGSFPQVFDMDGNKAIGASAVKGFLSFVKPLL
ncbi:phosphatidylserine/phosphatidylglycerophosphate/cardiolipin synthase family protein [Thermodesulfobacteriota bacterium]